MASSVTLNCGSYGRVRGVLSIVEQSTSGNWTKFRIVGTLFHDGTQTAHNANGAMVTVTGAYEWEKRVPFSIKGGSSGTMVNETFTINHRSDGVLGTQTVSIDIGETGTGTFGNPPKVTVDLNPPNIDRTPSAPSSISTSFEAPTSIVASCGVATSSSTITEYHFAYDDNSGFTSPSYRTGGTIRTGTITGLTRGTKYWIKARAKNAIGWGPFSEVTTRTIPNVPGAPTSLARSFKAPSSLTVTWVAPSSNGGASITGYDVQYASDSGFTSNVKTISTGTGLSATIPDAILGATTYIRVRAKNSQGEGSYSSSINYAVPNVPSAPGTPTLTATPPFTIGVEYTAPSSDGGASVTEYEIEYATNSSFTSSNKVSVTGLTTTLTNLTPGATYWVRIAAKNSQGTGAYSSAASAMLYAGPRINVNGTWKNSVAYINVNGVWKIAIPYVNVNGVWKIAGG